MDGDYYQFVGYQWVVVQFYWQDVEKIIFYYQVDVG